MQVLSLLQCLQHSRGLISREIKLNTIKLQSILITTNYYFCCCIGRLSWITLFLLSNWTFADLTAPSCPSIISVTFANFHRHHDVPSSFNTTISPACILLEFPLATLIDFLFCKLNEHSLSHSLMKQFNAWY